jgi:hypothetical protein
MHQEVMCSVQFQSLVLSMIRRKLRSLKTNERNNGQQLMSEELLGAIVA